MSPNRCHDLEANAVLHHSAFIAPIRFPALHKEKPLEERFNGLLGVYGTGGRVRTDTSYDTGF